MATKTTQCDSCAFKLIEDQSNPMAAKAIEDKYMTIRNAIGAPKKPRNAFVGGNDDRTETCLINASAWEKRQDNIHCPDRIDNSLNLESALTLRETKISNSLAERANQIAGDAKIWSIIAVIIAVIAVIIP